MQTHGAGIGYMSMRCKSDRLEKNSLLKQKVNNRNYSFPTIIENMD